ncbi:MAG: hypothetical protein QOG66_192 [Methylobacteriaceae bacterium]|nr:hypothetical protein [Methylobacteriaceae bacterium]
MSTRLSNGAVFALALTLIVGGAWGIWRGSDYIQLERGWASVISGSVAATGGVLALAIGFVLRRLDALHKALRAVGAVSTDMERPLEAPVAVAPVEPMPLGLAPAPVAHEPVAHEPEPQPMAAYTAPALHAAAAVNLELLEREERPAFGAEPHPSGSPPTETISTEAPPEVIHAAQQGPADDMAKAAGVSDEPELDAAIEQLLAEERGRGPHDGSAEQVPPPVSTDAAAEMPMPAVTPEVTEKAPQRSGWRGLFSRKQRRAGTPPAESAAEPVSPGAVDARIAPEGEARPDLAPTEEAAAEPDTIPRTGDDWFDRALSGLDEVDRPYGVGEVSEHSRQGTEQRADTGSKLQLQQPSLQEPPGVPAEPAVIGRYTSGNTTYIMFADGSIEAETPTGILRFASLAELKSYVEGGQ